MKVSGNIDIVSVPAMRCIAGVPGGQRRAKFRLAEWLKNRVPRVRVMPAQLALHRRQRTVLGEQKRRLIATQQRHAGTPGVGVQGLQKIAVCVRHYVTVRIQAARYRVITRFGQRIDAPFLFQQ